MKRVNLLWFCTLLYICVQANPAGYGYVKDIEVQASKVSGSGSLSSFPIFISTTDSDLKSVSNGGHIESSSGYDIIFTESDGTTILDHQIETYDETTGEYVAWVKANTLSASANTTIKMYYGNGAVVTDQSTTDVWSDNYVGVWHLNEDPTDGSGGMKDVAGSAYNGTADGSMVSGDLITGTPIVNGVDFDGSDDEVIVPSTHAPSFGSSKLTISAWIYLDGTTGKREIVNKKDGGSTTIGVGLRVVGGNNLQIAYQRDGVGNTNYKVSSTGTMTAGSWHYVNATFNTATDICKMYIDGVQDANIVDISGDGSLDNAENLYIGSKLGGNHFDGKIDEVRISKDIKNADWIATEYNNQSSPSTFYTISAEQVINPLPIELIAFYVTENDENSVNISWQTASETNNDYFTILYSTDGLSWAVIESEKGAGNTSTESSYTFTHTTQNPNGYYRLKQTDFDGSYAYSDIIMFSKAVNVMSDIVLFPNPTSEWLNIIHNETDLSFKILNQYGNDVTPLIQTEEQLSNRILINIASLPAGSYSFISQHISKQFIVL